MVSVAVILATTKDTMNSDETTSKTPNMRPNAERGTRSSKPPLTTRWSAHQKAGNIALRAGMSK